MKRTYATLVLAALCTAVLPSCNDSNSSNAVWTTPTAPAAATIGENTTAVFASNSETKLTFHPLVIPAAPPAPASEGDTGVTPSEGTPTHTLTQGTVNQSIGLVDVDFGTAAETVAATTWQYAYQSSTNGSEARILLRPVAAVATDKAVGFEAGATIVVRITCSATGSYMAEVVTASGVMAPAPTPAAPAPANETTEGVLSTPLNPATIDAQAWAANFFNGTVVFDGLVEPVEEETPEGDAPEGDTPAESTPEVVVPAV